MDSTFNLMRVYLGARLLAALGAINWGIIGVMGENLLALLLGQWPFLLKFTYILVGMSGFFMLFTPKGRVWP